ncbi:PQQ-binding-like beta-propeller repeat protein [uncultured Paraglaciecola sp.]|uniref:WD40 repeat domain-containing protein n=1 Tax=uncultured Paraglaciecola sp. TaxID=1765024 RepID=UPI0025D7F961|nr:PQQ-binding-like beta-propeller repeat protein [uncultured Paraglaciecola sp.]
MACGGSSNVPVSSVRHAEGGSHASHISADNTITVVSTIENGITVWDLAKNEQRFVWRHQDDGNNSVTNIHIAFDNSYVVTSDREAFALWNLDIGEPEGFWRIDEASIRDIAVSNQGRGILVGRGNGKVMFFEPKTGRRLEFLGHQEKINSVDISPNGFYALTGGNDYLAYLWDTRTGQVIHKFDHTSRVTKVALDDNGRYAFTADSKRDARVWDLVTGKEVSNLRFSARQRIFTAAVFSDDGKYLLTGSPARRINRWDVETGKELNEWRVSAREGSKPASAVVHDIGFTSENEIISESSSGLLEKWKIEN